MSMDLDTAQAHTLARWLALSADFRAPAGEAGLDAWYAAWTAALPQDPATRLQRLAAHDLRICLHEALARPLEELADDVRMDAVLPRAGRRAFWEGLQDACEWTLPRMGLPGWAQTLFGLALIAGFVLPFWWPLWGSLLIPVALFLSFFLENRVAYLPQRTLADVAARMVVLNEPGIQLGKFAEEDLERVFYALACMACDKELPLEGWDRVRVAAR